jgi:hypothetical protein
MSYYMEPEVVLPFYAKNNLQDQCKQMLSINK